MTRCDDSRGIVSSAKHLSLLILVVVICLQARADVSYDNFDSKGWSRSRHISEESQVFLSLNLIEQGIQNQDLRQVAVAACPELSDNSIDSIVAKFESTFAGLVDDGEELLPAANVGLYGGTINAFRWFAFEPDSVITTRNGATAYVHGSWLTPGERSRGEGKYSLAFSKSGNRWRPSDLAPVMIALSDYLSQTAALLQLRAEIAEPSSRDAYDDYSEFLTFSSKHLLLERDIMSQHPRFTAAVAAYEYQERVFSCLGMSSMFHYEGDPLTGNLSVSAVADPCWQRFLLGNYVPGEEEDWFLFAKGYAGVGSTLGEFRQPGGLEFRLADMLYICDRGNDRIKVVLVDPDWPDKMMLSYIIDNKNLSDPIDLDVARDGKVVVAEYGSNSVVVFCDHEWDPPPGECTGLYRHYTASPYGGAITLPLSVSFGRDPISSEKTSTIYVVDKNGRRILRGTNVFSSSPVFFSFEDFPDPITQISCVAVDNHGLVWAVDRERGRVYKFDASLNLLSIHGEEGEGYAQYSYPTGLSFAPAYQYQDEWHPPVPMPAMSEGMITEKWGPVTGVRRLVAGVDVIQTDAHYYPQLESGAQDYIDLEFRVTGYSDTYIDFYSPTDELLESRQDINDPPSIEYRTWFFPQGAPSGTYRFEITAQSVNIDANTATATVFVDVDRSLVNQQPVITNLFFPGGDSCFVTINWTVLELTVDDEDSSAVSYNWWSEPYDDFVFLNQGVNPCSLYYNGRGEGRGLPSIIRATVTDDFGQVSDTYEFEIGSELLVASDNDCLDGCRVGDANADGLINISDALAIQNWIFNNGDPPVPVLSGDANCSGETNVTDMVYIIAYVFGSGPAPGQCCNCDTNWCE